MGDMKRGRKALFCLIVAVIIAVCFGGGLSGFVVNGKPAKISGVIKTGVNDNWSGNVFVTGDVYVPRGVTLTIQIGTTIRFADRKDDQNGKINVVEDRPLKCFPEERAELLVAGKLIAQGALDNLITFTGDWASKSKNLPYGQWGGIVIFGDAKPTTLKYLVITYAEIGITIDNDSTIENSFILSSRGSLCDRLPLRDPSNPNRVLNHADVRVGVLLRGGGGSTVRNNLILWNTWGIHANTGGIGKASITIERNGILLNSTLVDGFDVPNGIHVYQAKADIKRNWIYGNYWGIEVSKSIIQVQFNEFEYNTHGFVWYFEDDKVICQGSLLIGNSTLCQTRDYVKQTKTGSLALPNWWFGK